MNEQIDEVEAEEGESAEAIVEGEGQEADVAAAGEIEVVEVFNFGVVDDIGWVVEMEGGGEGVGVDQCGDQAEKQQGGQRVGKPR